MFERTPCISPPGSPKRGQGGRTIGHATLVRMARSTNTKPVRNPEARAQAPNPVWFKPLMFGFMLLGLVWIIVFYVSGSNAPIPSLQNWNIVVGFGIMAIGFLMTTRWR
jgi:hypothetical protein